ncbi:glycosyltransferase family 1 protein [Thioalkalivibrio sp. ALE19]|uniref:glycosyltransferase family 4 protein n=1 Tax=Thioalkalivibrio sp. ALE19 TaxID=1266909 RepID=UPI0004137787|nr:glycosyltransferase family 1 protein [Thioalkalivibrio sp. ALE19]
MTAVMTSRIPAAASSGVQAARGEPQFPKVAVVTETWPPEINGVALTLSRLVNGLRETGYAVEVVRPRQAGDRPLSGTSGPAAEEHTVPGVPLPGYPGLRAGLPVRRRLLRHWKRARPGVVHIATEGPLGHAALSAARRLGIPVSSAFHTRFDGYMGYYGMAWARPLALAFLRRFHNRCDCTLVPTRALASELESSGFRGIRVLERGVDTGLFSPARRSWSLRDEWEGGVDAPVLISVGRLAPEKAPEDVIRAWEAVRARLPRARLVMVGDGPSRAALEARHPEVIFTGMRTGADLAAHYASADLFVFASRSETFGNVVIEAMASGLPVLAFDEAAAREHLREGENGVRVPLSGNPADDSEAFAAAALDLAERRCRDRLAWRVMGQAARQRAEGLDWERIVGRFGARLTELGRIGGGEGQHASAATGR